MKLGGEKGERRRLVAIVALAVVAFFLWRRFGPEIDIEAILEDLSRRLGEWTYALVGVLAFLETGAFVGLVFPGETTVILGGAVAGQGEISLPLTIAIAWSCAWAGDSVSFLIGTRLGRGFVLKHGPRVRITHERFAQVEQYFDRHGGKTILIGRFIGLVRALAPFIAGSSGMAYRAFVPYSILGTGLWAATFSLLGYFISENIGRAADLASRGIFVFGGVVAVVLAIVLGIRFMRKRENRTILARRLEAYALGRPVVAFGRRIEPQARFLWHRLTPGGLGLELTSLLAVLSVALFVLLAYWSVVVGEPGATGADTEAFRIADELTAPWLTDVAKVVTTLGSGAFTLVVALAAAVALALRRRWTELAVLAAAMAMLHVALPVVKEIVDRPRPAGGLVEVDGAAYPSGHAAYSVIYTWVALTVALRLRPGMANATALILGGIAMSAAIGLSRVYLHVHYLSDVSGGWALGVSVFASCAIVALVVVHLRQNSLG